MGLSLGTLDLDGFLDGGTAVEFFRCDWSGYTKRQLLGAGRKSEEAGAP